MSMTTSVPTIQITLAGPEDEPELRALLRENPVPGPISLSYEREPDFFLASRIEGDRNQTLVARDGDSGKMVALGSRSFHTAFLNGEARRIGYLSQLRLDRSFRGRAHLLFRGYEKLRELHEKGGDVPFYLTSLVDGNFPAQRLLTSGHTRLPRYHFLESFRMLVLDVQAFQSITDGQTARTEDLPEIAACLQRQAARYQLCRCWTTEDLLSPERSKGLSAGDFQVVFSRDRILGCLALWDQSSFKQTVVRGYTPVLGFFRPAANAFAALCGRSLALPEVGQPLRMAYLSHMAIEGDDSQLLSALIRGVVGRARVRGIRYLVLGLSVRNPMLRAAREAFSAREYGSALHVVHWEDGDEAVRALDSRPCHVEAATL